MASIPKIIHQIWLGPKQRPANLMETWKEKHPDWEYRLWTEDNLPQLRNQEQFDRSGNRYHQKSDILRYELLYDYGGVYVDADSYCIKPIDDLLEGVEMFAGLEGNPKMPDLVANGTIGCSKHNPDMLKIIENVKIKKLSPTWVTVGPKYFTDMIEKHRMNIKLYPPHIFYPIHHTVKGRLQEIDLTDPRMKDSYATQVWGSTWMAYKPDRQKQPVKWFFWKIREKMKTVSDMDAVNGSDANKQ